ncbi:MAG: hypothetical protein RMJ51_03550 [Candidatus Calescibacterium sp.]|nr:hypothetical protein [Candidatus Calescibacterium sp.]MDW8195300.1 hypothetical protein [Candidatus Calescibacterium sp.]
MKKTGLSALISLSLLALILSGCTTEQIATIETPTDLTKEIEITEGPIEDRNVNIEEVRKKLVSKPFIPEKRETSDLKDPFIVKSLKGIKIARNNVNESKSEVEKQDQREVQQQSDQKQFNTETTEVQRPEEKSVNIAEESPMMFNFEGLSISENERRAILRHLVNNRSYIVKIGDIVGGYTVNAITDDNLILIKGNEKLVITKKKK